MRRILVIFLSISSFLVADTFRAHLPGAWYPSDAQQLRAQLTQMGERAHQHYDAVLDSKSVRMLIVPHAGYAYSGTVASAVYRLVRNAPIKRVIILAPSHYVGFTGVCLPAFDAYQTPLGTLPVDMSAIQALQAPLFFKHPQDVVFHKEHALEIQLPFIQFYMNQVAIVPILVGDISDEQARTIAQSLRPLLNNETLVVVSSDFTHYGSSFNFTPFTQRVREHIKQLDAQAVAAIEQKSVPAFSAFLDKTHDTICGRNAVKIALNLLPSAVEPRLIAYATSADDTVQIDQSVSYVGLVFTAQKRAAEPLKDQITQQEKRELVRYALASISSALGSGVPESLIQPIPSPIFQEPRGAFVTLYKNGELRGCIGRIITNQPLLQTVHDMALAAAFNDSRFSPVTKQELPEIRVSVSVLTQPQAVPTYHSIVLGRHGIIIKQGANSAVYLPKVAPEQGWDLQTTLRNLSLKAGLSADAWQEKNTAFEVFESIDCSE